MDISSILAVLGVLSLSVERVVEMIKNLIPFLSNKYEGEENVAKERFRRFGLQFLAALIGFIVALVAQEQIDYVLFKGEGTIGCWGCVILGFLASGGSGFWNQSLGIVEEIKKAKKLESSKLKS